MATTFICDGVLLFVMVLASVVEFCWILALNLKCDKKDKANQKKTYMELSTCSDNWFYRNIKQ